MSWKQRELRICAEEEVLLREAFGETGLLFLGAAPLRQCAADLPLVLKSSPLPMTYVLFLNRRRRVLASALRSDAVFSGGLPREIRPGETFQLGCRRFRVEWRDGMEGLRARRWWLLFLALASMVMVAAAIGWRSPNPSAPRSPPPVVKALVPGISSEALAQARELMREGRRAEARLALTAAIEEDPTDEEAKRLLQAILDQREEAVQAGGERFVTVQELFDQGREALRRSEPLSARQHFQQAQALIGMEVSAVAAELRLAAKEAEAAIRRQQAPAIERVQAILAAASGVSAEAATIRLVEAKAIATAVVQQLPEDIQVRKLLGRIEQQLASAVRRWFAVADTEAHLQGCRVAAPTYRKIAAALSQADPALAALASERAERCRP